VEKVRGLQELAFQLGLEEGTQLHFVLSLSLEIIVYVINLTEFPEHHSFEYRLLYNVEIKKLFLG
jgi:hypothetical protein